MKYPFHSTGSYNAEVTTRPFGVGQILIALLMAFAIIMSSYSGSAKADRRHGHHSGHHGGLIASGILPKRWTRRLHLDDTQVTMINGIIQDQLETLQSLQTQIKQLRGELWVLVQNSGMPDPTEPGDDTTEPGDDTTDPGDDTTDPGDDTTDPAVDDVEALAAELADLLKQVLVIRTDIRIQIYQLLTPEQQAKLDRLIGRRFGDLMEDDGSDDDGMDDDGMDDDGMDDDGMDDDGSADDDGMDDDGSADEDTGDPGTGDPV